MKKEQKFAKGIYFGRRDVAPKFVIGNVSIKVADFIPFIKEHENNAGYVNIDILESKEGKNPYCVLNQYTPTNQKKEVVEQKIQDQEIEYPDDHINIDDIPF